MSANDAETDALVGYLPESDQRDSTTALSCADGPFSVSSHVATCCPSTGSCRIPTTCLANTLWYTAGNQRCGSGSTCATITIYESAGNIEAQEQTLQYHCQQTATNDAYNTLYRENPARVTESSPSETSKQDGGSTSSTESDESAASPSKGWIAGAVIGPLVFILVCGLAFWIWRRRSSQPHPQQPSAEASDATGKPELPGSTTTGATLAGSGAGGWDKPELGGPERYEVPGNNLTSYGPPRSELVGSGQIRPSSTADRHELYGNERFYQELPAESTRTEHSSGNGLAS